MDMLNYSLKKEYYVLVKELGQVDAIRFLQDMEWGFAKRLYNSLIQTKQQKLRNLILTKVIITNQY